MTLSLRIFILFLFTSLLLPAQQKDPLLPASNGLKENISAVSKFSIPQAPSGKNILVLEIPFAKADFIAPQLAAAAKGKLIERVQLVYTTYRESPSFDQKGLNQQRLKNLFSLLPDAFASPLTEWELVAQTGAASPEEGRNYFHGFIITWRADASPELVKNELKMLDSLFATARKTEPVIPDKKEPLKPGEKVLTGADGTKITIDRDIPEDSLWRFIKPSGEGFSVVYAKYGDTAHSTVIVTETTAEGYKRKRTWKLDDEHVSDKPFDLSFSDADLHTPDSVVTTVMRRNSWQHMVMVCDVTGSMSPYSAQVMAWVPLGLSGGRCSGFVFFNDGDSKKNNDKDVGKTGGIYGTSSQSLDTVMMTLRKTMRNGDGGDLPENPVEAMIWAINHFPENSEIILVADNFSSPRDLELFAKVNRPVHIILCGARGIINPDYLFLARQTHGTLHTLTDDVTTLDQLKDGEQIQIGSKHYLLKNEHFICMETFSRY